MFEVKKCVIPVKVELFQLTPLAIRRLVNIVVRSLQELPSSKEDGSLIASAGHQLLFQSENSVLWPCNIFNLVKTLPEVLQLLRSNPSAVAQEMRELRHDLTDPRAMRIVVEGDILALRKPTEPWTSFVRLSALDDLESPLTLLDDEQAHLSPFDISELEPVKRERDLMSSLGRRPSRKASCSCSPNDPSLTFLTRRWSSIDCLQPRDPPTVDTRARGLDASIRITLPWYSPTALSTPSKDICGKPFEDPVSPMEPTLPSVPRLARSPSFCTVHLMLTQRSSPRAS